MENLSKNQLMLGGGVIVIIIIIGWFILQGSSAPEPAVSTVETAIVLPEEAALVSDIGKTAETATLKDAIPVVAPSINPIENIYKNPFE